MLQELAFAGPMETSITKRVSIRVIAFYGGWPSTFW